MDLNSPETWRWLWAVFAVVFLVGEVITPALFFFLPFAIGAAAASVMSFGHSGLGVEWSVFLGVSLVSFLGLWRLGRKLERRDQEQEGVGATRWVGQEARVTEDIAERGIGTVRLEREQWRAESLTGAAIRRGSTVIVTRMAGTRLVVVPTDEPFDETFFTPNTPSIPNNPLFPNNPLSPNKDVGGNSDPARGAT